MSDNTDQPNRSRHTGKTILLVIGGGIAAYKSLELIRACRQVGMTPRCVMTAAAQQFIAPLSASSLSGQKVYTDLFSLTDDAEMGHIELSRSADVVCVVPATADLLAKMANGLSDDLASTLLLATDKKILVAPAMNLRMWLHPSTQRNISRLLSDGVTIIGPDNGAMACGEFGPGRMAEPAAILAAIEAMLDQNTHIPLPNDFTADPAIQHQGWTQLLAGKHVLITSGPTHEPIDPVRYIANRSSGKQGHALAAAAVAAGATVTLVSGPVSIPFPAGVQVIQVETAAEMLSAVQHALPADIFIAAAAVADWQVADVHTGKVKKRGGLPPELKLLENPDILRTIASDTKNRPPIVVGFAAETSDLIENAQRKLESKGCDLIVANDVNPETGIMGGAENTVHLITRDCITSWPKLDKRDVATKLIDFIANGLFASSKEGHLR